MEPITLTSENFDEIINSPQPVLVDFWAAWCGPCKMLSPIVDAVAKEADGFRVGKVDADTESDLCSRFNVSSIPTLIVFKNGEVVDKSTGFIPKEKVLELVNNAK